jgi:hypothetical protein
VKRHADFERPAFAHAATLDEANHFFAGIVYAVEIGSLAQTLILSLAKWALGRRSLVVE